MTKIQLVAACAAAIGAPIVALGLGTSTASADPRPIHDAVHQVIGDVHQVRADVRKVVWESFKAIPGQPTNQPNLKPVHQAVTVTVQDSVKTVHDTVNVAHTTVKTVTDHVHDALGAHRDADK
jgi:hypothetical protein